MLQDFKAEAMTSSLIAECVQRRRSSDTAAAAVAAAASAGAASEHPRAAPLLDLQKWAAEASAAGSPPWEAAAIYERRQRGSRARSVSPGPSTSRSRPAWSNGGAFNRRPRSIHVHTALPSSDSADTLHSPSSPTQTREVDVSLPASPYPSAPSTLSRASALKIKPRARPLSLRARPDEQHVRFQADVETPTPRTALLSYPPMPADQHSHFVVRNGTREGIHEGLGSVGASADSAGLVLRRGSSSTPVTLNEGPVFAEDVFGAPPLLSKESLLEIGRVEGITPPSMASESSASGSGVPELSAVVSAGLEMGLGVHLATSALHNNLPGASAAVSSLAEPRFARPGTIDFEAISLAAKLTEREVWTDDRGPGPHTAVAVFEDPMAAAFDYTDSQLARRRTTGSAPTSAGGRRRSTDTQRARAGTHDFGSASSAAKQQALKRAGLAFTSDHDVPSSVSSPSIDFSSSTGEHRHRASASITDSTQIGTPSMADRALLSPATSHHMSSAGGFLGGTDKPRASARDSERREGPAEDHHVAAPHHRHHHQHGGLIGGGGHFGPGVRAKVLEVLDQLIDGVPLSGEEGETVTIVEYGSLQGRSLPLMQPIITKFSAKAHAHLHPEHHMPDAASRVAFSLIHEDVPQADFRPLMQQLDNISESYLNAIWQSRSQPSLQNAIFPSFVSRPFASRVAPPKSIHMGLSLMDLHWAHTPLNPAISISTTADAELTAFLAARAHEFKQGGALVLAYIARSEEDGRLRQAPSLRSLSAAAGTHGEVGPQQANGDAPPPTRRTTDLWSTLTNLLAPCIQRLVSCGMLKSDVARHMLSLPLHPRTAKQTNAVLKSAAHQWRVEWSCGLGHSGASPHAPQGACPSEPDPVRIAHPAWKALESGTLSRVAFAEHMIQLFKNLYEAHFRALLRERGKLSKGAVEFVLDSLWDVLHSRIDDEGSQLFDGVELEVCITALRRL